MNRYSGKILEVDLNTSRLTNQSIDEKTARKLLGGEGLGLNILYDDFKHGVDPLGPENKIVFTTCPATGTSFPTGGRYHVMAMKSPLTAASEARTRVVDHRRKRAHVELLCMIRSFGYVRMKVTFPAYLSSILSITGICW